MVPIHDGVAMAKKKTNGPPPSGERVTVLNIKGSVAERDYLHRLSRATGVPAAEIARRGMAMWAAGRGVPAPPAHWVGG